MGNQYGLRELRRRGKVMRFLSQYGAIAKFAVPDRTVALLATNAKHAFHGNGSYDLHAVYHHLTHLGFPPAIVTEDSLTADSGVLTKETRLLVLVNVDDPLSDELVASIRQFQKRGGKVL